MGNWNINIQGIGVHHNTANETDADRMAYKFAKELMKAGHIVEVATFTYGGKNSLPISPGPNDWKPEW